MMSFNLARKIRPIGAVSIMMLLMGCGGKVTLHEEFALAENMTIPAVPTLPAMMPALTKQGVNIGKEDFVWPQTSGPVLLGEVCGISELLDLADSDISSILQSDEGVPIWARLLFRRVKVESVIVENITLRASQGDFSFLNHLSYDIRSKETGNAILFAEAGGVFGPEVVLQTEDEFNLLKMEDQLEGTDCIESYLGLEGALPTQDVVFNAVMNIKIELHVGWVL